MRCVVNTVNFLLIYDYYIFEIVLNLNAFLLSIFRVARKIRVIYKSGNQIFFRILHAPMISAINVSGYHHALFPDALSSGAQLKNIHCQTCMLVDK